MICYKFILETADQSTSLHYLALHNVEVVGGAWMN